MARTATGARLCVGALALIISVTAMAQPMSEALIQKSSDAAAIVRTARERGYARVIVMFAPPIPPGEMRPDPAVLASVKEKVRAQQDAILQTHFGALSGDNTAGFDRALRRLEISPMFAINATRTEIELLAKDWRVLRIEPDTESRSQ